MVAAREAEDTLPCNRLMVLDTKSASGGQGLIALEAWRRASNGDGLEDVVTAVQKVMSSVRLTAFLDTLFYLWKGGRVPGIMHVGTSLLKIKPLFELKGGRVRRVARPRTYSKAMEMLMESMREQVGTSEVHAMVVHADAANAADELRRRVEDEFYCSELSVSEFTPVMGAQTGPGLLGVAYWSL